VLDPGQAERHQPAAQRDADHADDDHRRVDVLRGLVEDLAEAGDRADQLGGDERRPRCLQRKPEPREDGGRKLAGVLIEVRSGIALVGVGINVLHGPDDFPPHLRSQATSISMVGRAHGSTVEPDRFSTLLALIRADHAAVPA